MKGMRGHSRTYPGVPRRFERLANLLAAGANPNRLYLLHLCADEGYPETIAEFAEVLGEDVRTQALYPYLDWLYAAGLVVRDVEGRSGRYRATAVGRELLALLAPLLEEVTPTPGPDPPSSA